MADDTRLSEARHRIPVLIVQSKGSKAAQLRQVLIGLGFDKIQLCNSYMKGLVEAKQDNSFSLVFFESLSPDGSELSTEQFIEVMKKLLRKPTLIAMDEQSDGNRMFELMKLGAKGFLIPPFNSEAIENAFTQIQQGYQLSDEVLHSSDRNRALSDLILQHFSKLVCEVTLSKQNGNLSSTEDCLNKFHQTVKVAKFFAEVSPIALFEKLHEHLYEKALLKDAEAEKSRLRMTRDKLRAARQTGR